MKIGIRASADQLAAAAQTGFDYVEMDLNAILRMDINAYRGMANEMEKRNIYAQVVCGMLPESMRIVGEGVSAQDIHVALDHAFETAQALGAQIIVFDCAASRRLPSGFDPAMAWRQMGNFIRILQGHASKYDLHAAILPMCRRDCDLINHISEAVMVPAMLSLDRVGVAVSSYHMAKEAEMMGALRRTGSLLWHVRTSDALTGRMPRTGDGQDYRELADTLRGMNYEGAITCEGACDDFEAEAEEAYRCIREAIGKL